MEVGLHELLKPRSGEVSEVDIEIDVVGHGFVRVRFKFSSFTTLGRGCVRFRLLVVVPFGFACVFVAFIGARVAAFARDRRAGGPLGGIPSQDRFFPDCGLAGACGARGAAA